MSPTAAIILACVDAAVFAFLGYSWMWPWIRARRERIPLRLLGVVTLWAEGAPTHELIDAFIRLRHAGTPASIGQLRDAWWRDRYRIHDSVQLAQAARELMLNQQPFNTR